VSWIPIQPDRPYFAMRLAERFRSLRPLKKIGGCGFWTGFAPNPHLSKSANSASAQLGGFGARAEGESGNVRYIVVRGAVQSILLRTDPSAVIVPPFYGCRRCSALGSASTAGAGVEGKDG